MPISNLCHFVLLDFDLESNMQSTCKRCRCFVIQPKHTSTYILAIWIYTDIGKILLKFSSNSFFCLTYCSSLSLTQSDESLKSSNNTRHILVFSLLLPMPVVSNSTIVSVSNTHNLFKTCTGPRVSMLPLLLVGSCFFDFNLAGSKSNSMPSI